MVKRKRAEKAAAPLPFQPGDRVMLNQEIKAEVVRCTHNALTLKFVGNLEHHVPRKPG